MGVKQQLACVLILFISTTALAQDRRAAKKAGVPPGGNRNGMGMRVAGTRPPG